MGAWGWGGVPTPLWPPCYGHRVMELGATVCARMWRCREGQLPPPPRPRRPVGARIQIRKIAVPGGGAAGRRGGRRRRKGACRAAERGMPGGGWGMPLLGRLGGRRVGHAGRRVGHAGPPPVGTCSRLGQVKLGWSEAKLARREVPSVESPSACAVAVVCLGFCCDSPHTLSATRALALLCSFSKHDFWHAAAWFCGRFGGWVG
jgi:hypothetical protein